MTMDFSRSPGSTPRIGWTSRRWAASIGVSLLLLGIALACSDSDARPEKKDITGAEAGSPRGDACSACTSDADCLSGEQCVFSPDGKRACAHASGSTECCDGNDHCKTYVAKPDAGMPLG